MIGGGGGGGPASESPSNDPQLDSIDCVGRRRSSPSLPTLSGGASDAFPGGSDVAVDLRSHAFLYGLLVLCLWYLSCMPGVGNAFSRSPECRAWRRLCRWKVPPSVAGLPCWHISCQKTQIWHVFEGLACQFWRLAYSTNLAYFWRFFIKHWLNHLKIA